MIPREAFLRRTAVRFRVKTGANRGLNAREVDLAEFVYDELCQEITETIQAGMQEMYLTPLREIDDAELGNSG